MNENQIKTKIFLLRSLDTTLVLALMGAGIYAVFYAPNREFMIMMCLVGLFLVNILGKATNKKISLLGVQLERLKRDNRAEEQRALMSSRHGKNFSSKPTASKTNPVTKKQP
jgi:hypothetical protein